MSAIYTRFRKEVGTVFSRLEKERPEADAYSLGADAERIVFDAWLAASRFDDLTVYVLEAFNPGYGDFWILLLSEALRRADETERLKTLWREVIAGRRKHWGARLARPAKETAKKLKELRDQWEGPLERRYGDVELHFWHQHGTGLPRAHLLWALEAYSHALMKGATDTRILRDDALWAEHRWIDDQIAALRAVEVS